MNEKIIEKIRKTLNLANNNSNEHEAKLAILKAQEIMAQYNITMKDVELRKEIEKKNAIEMDATEASGRTPWWVKSLAPVIADNFKCHPYISKGYGTTKIVFIGLEEDVAIAVEVYKYAIEAIYKYATSYIQKLYREKKQSKGMRNEFITGFIHGLKEAFKKQVECNNYAMVLVKDPVVVQAVQAKNLVMYKPTGIKPKFSGSEEARVKGFEKGKEFGSNENRNKKIEL